MGTLWSNRSYFILNVYLLGVICVCCGEHISKSVEENRDDNGDNNDEGKDEMEIPSEAESTNVTCARRQNSIMHPIQSATRGQFPFMAALMSNNDEYLCAGTLISNGMILTSATCTNQPVGYVLLNALNAKKAKDDDVTVVLHVTKTEKYPTYVGGESLKDVAIVYTKKHHNGSNVSPINISNYTNGRALVDIEAFGYGLNSEVGETKELQYVGLENRSPFEIGNIMKAYIDCIDTKVVTCFKDVGGPVIFSNELVGIVIAGQDECSKEMTSAYAINKRMVTVLPTYAFKSWLSERINAANDTLRLEPAKRVRAPSSLPVVYDSAASRFFVPATFTYLAVTTLLLCSF